ncbi:phage tail protein [Nostoc sp.]|uniref:phage tail protein n=1 Tax=Nostoc sp. TaxID=1180 RepID=UPI002FF67BA2
MSITPEKSIYLEYLPTIFEQDSFLGCFLLAFEQVLTGLENIEPEPKQGLEESISKISKLFSPNDIFQYFVTDRNINLSDIDEETQQTIKDFLQWLAGWTALNLRADWGIEKQREFIAKIVPLYRGRGTKNNLEELLEIYTGLIPTIEQPKDTPFQIGKYSKIGVDTQIGGGAIPHFFYVNVTIARPPDEESFERQKSIIKALINLQKPAHTDYELKLFSEPMQIGVRSTIGRDTFLGILKNQPG